MSDTVVSIEGLGKRYRVRRSQSGDRYQTLRDTLAHAASAPLRWLSGTSSGAAVFDDFWALRDVSFGISRGDVIGIVGRNGAGKSTLLKILSRITEPTTGRVTIDGRVASLLEVGTGFHPELTGRENIFLNAAILGMTRAETTRKFDEIVAFAEVAPFLDTPVKRYSSGMYVRLAFAVAAHLEPDVLVVDEVLAVGDASFQKKSLGKMHEVSRGGRTVLFVSHNMAAVQALCTRAVWLDQGTLAREGPVSEVVNAYLRSGEQPTTALPGQPLRAAPSLDLLRFDLSPNPLTSGGRLNFDLAFRAREATTISELALLIYSPLEVRVAILDLRPFGCPIALAAGDTQSFRGAFKSVPLVDGEYHVGFGLRASGHAADHLRLAVLRVLGPPPSAGIVPYAPEYRGVVEMELEVSPAHG